MCDCISKVPKNCIGVRTQQGRQVLSAHIVEKHMLADQHMNLRVVTYSNIECDVEGKNKSIKLPMSHNYCPFCGTQYEELK